MNLNPMVCIQAQSLKTIDQVIEGADGQEGRPHQDSYNLTGQEKFTGQTF